MKIIDKTPLLNEKGELGFVQRIQGMTQFGFNWPSELQAQKAIINYFDRQLEKGYTLIRNYTLGKSGITVPIILLGPTGIHVIHVAYLKGQYEARGEEWNVASGNGYKPAPENLVHETLRMAKAVRAFIERQGVQVPVEVEPVLIAGDPGLHVEAVKPAIRVLMIDGIKSYVAGLATAEPVLRAEMVYELTDRLLNPHPARKTAAVAVSPVGEPALESAPVQLDPFAARAQALFKSSGQVNPFNPADFDFAVEDEMDFDLRPAVAPSPVASTPTPSAPAPLAAAKPRPRRYLGMTGMQLSIVIVLALVLLCIVAGFVYYFLAIA
jgi:hypothetical protein